MRMSTSKLDKRKNDSTLVVIILSLIVCVKSKSATCPNADSDWLTLSLTSRRLLASHITSQQVAVSVRFWWNSSETNSLSDDDPPRHAVETSHKHATMLGRRGVIDCSRGNMG